MTDDIEYVLCITHQRGVEFVRPKFWTGGMLERWPELVSNKDRAHRFSSKKAADEVRAGFASRGFAGEVQPA